MYLCEPSKCVFRRKFVCYINNLKEMNKNFMASSFLYHYLLRRNILHEIRKRKANWIGHILRRNCILQQVIKGKIKGQIEVTRRR